MSYTEKYFWKDGIQLRIIVNLIRLVRAINGERKQKKRVVSQARWKLKYRKNKRSQQQATGCQFVNKNIRYIGYFYCVQVYNFTEQ